MAKIVQISIYCQLKTACCLPYRQVVELNLINYQTKKHGKFRRKKL